MSLDDNTSDTAHRTPDGDDTSAAVTTDADTSDAAGESVPVDPHDVLFAGVPAPTGGAWWRLGSVFAALAAAFYFSPALVSIIVGIFLLVAVHEFGHLLASRASGVIATEYSIGMGPLVYSTRRAQMAWSLRLLPLGAFVRVVGMTADDDIPDVYEARTYRRASLPRRLAIVLAGPFANFALAAVLMALSLTTFGVVRPENWTISNVSEQSAAAMAGLRPGEQIVSINGTEVSGFDKLSDVIAANPGEDVALVVSDPETSKTRKVTATLGSRVAVWGTVGEDLVVDEHDDGSLVLSGVGKGGVLAAAGLRDGDQVLGVNGTDVADPAAFQAAVNDTDKGDIELTVQEPSGVQRTAVVDLGEAVAAQDPTGVLGITHGAEPERLAPLEALGATADQMAQATTASVGGIARFLWPPNLVEFITSAPAAGDQPTVPTPAGQPADPNRVLSIVGAVALGSDVAAASAWAGVLFLALMSLFVGLFNLLPVLPFDGGHAVIAVYESIREALAPQKGRHLTSPKVSRMVTAAVLTVLLVVGAAAVWLDVVAPVSG